MLALTLGVGNGHLDPAGFVLMVAALVLAALGISSTAAGIAAYDEAQVVNILGLGIALGFIVHVVRSPGSNLENAAGLAKAPFLLGLAGVGTLVAGAVWRPERWQRVRLPALIAIHVLLGVWLIRHCPRPQIDVFTVHKEAVDALLKGINPYAITFTDIYGANSPFYVSGMVIGGKVQAGYPYPPLNLLFATIAEGVAGDFRYGELAAMAITGGLIAKAGRTRVGFLTAALFLFAPRTYFMLEQGWTDSYVSMFLALVLFCACRWPRALPVALGLFLGSKQYTVLVIPLFPLLVPDRQQWRSTAIKAALVAAVVVLPGMLWDLQAYWVSLYRAQFRQPFRTDSLSVPAAIAYVTSWRLPSMLGFVAAAATTVIAWRHCPRTPSGFAAAVAAVYFAFFAFGTRAFCNYYFFVGSALCLAVATASAGKAFTSPVEPLTPNPE
jgi:hypothetical protein